MTRRSKINILIICVVCLLTCVLSGFTTTQASEAEAPHDRVSLFMNGIKVADGLSIEGSTYVSLRSFTEVIGVDADIAWDEKTSTATVTSEGLELSVISGSNYISANGRCFYLPLGVQNYNGSVIVPIRDLAKLFGASVEWDTESASVSIIADQLAPIAAADVTYNKDDLYWLARIINAEAGNQPLDGKIAVGNVVQNRVADPTCPDTIYGVIFDNKFGVQFSVTTNGAIYAEPNAESLVAAKLCLEGCNVVGNSIYFVNPDIGVSSWFAKTRAFVATIGEHDFYA
ncbi:MAG: cell wall hydrolase [Oscillospiraceae bacterium]